MDLVLQNYVGKTLTIQVGHDSVVGQLVSVSLSGHEFVAKVASCGQEYFIRTDHISWFRFDPFLPENK